MKIFITGDIHSDATRFSTGLFPEQRELTKDDFVIVCGDFGLIWDYHGESDYEKHWLNWLEEKSFTTLFIDGNHENFERLMEYPEEAWHGGRIHRINSSVFHLMRGYVFEICGKKIFTFGGAASHDVQDGILDPQKDREKIWKWRNDWSRLYRIRGESWWEQELPSQEEMDRGIENLKNVGDQVDFIITHTPPASVLAVVGDVSHRQNVLTRYLEDEVRQKVVYDKWFCGHVHIDWQYSDRDIVLYKNIRRIV